MSDARVTVVGRSKPHRIVLFGAFGLLAALAALPCLPSLRGQPVWEDADLMSGAALGNPTSVRAALTSSFLGHYWRPVTSLSFYLNRLWFGPGVTSFHLVNLLLHVLATLAVAGAVWLAWYRLVGLVAAGAVFALHPIHVSSVAWIGGRTDSLCTLWLSFFVLSVVSSRRATGVVGWLATGCGLVTYSLAVLSKEQAALVALVVPFTNWAFATEPETVGRRLRATVETGLYAGAAAAIGILWLHYIPGKLTTAPSSFMAMFAIATRTVSYYGWLVAAPGAVSLFTVTLHRLLLPVWAVVGCALILAAVALFGYLCRVNRPGAWFALFGGLAILPALNLIPAPSLVVAPYRAAEAAIAIAALAGCGAGALYAKLRTDEARSVACALAAFGLVYIGGIGLWSATVWSRELNACGEFLNVNPESQFAVMELAAAWLDARNPAQAVALLNGLTRPDAPVAGASYRHLPGVYPAQSTDYTEFAGILYVRAGYDFEKVGNFSEADRAFQLGRALYPKLPAASIGMAHIAWRRQDWSGCAMFLRDALRLDPSLAEQRLFLERLMATHGLH